MTAPMSRLRRTCGCRGAYLHEKSCSMAGLQIGDFRRSLLDRPLLGVAQHRLDLYEEGSFSGATVVCLGGSYSECQWWCAEPGADCEECSPDDHPWEPIESCRIADWINGAGLDDTYAGDVARLQFDDEGDKQPGIVSGLIATAWTGTDYVWRFPVEVPR